MIKEKIDEKSSNDAVASLLMKIFIEELNHRSEGKGWRYGDIYDSAIEKHCEQYHGEK